MLSVLKNLYSYDSKRAYTNQHYIIEGWKIAEEHLGKEAAKKEFFTSAGNSKNQAILEQIGRMSLQNKYDAEICEVALDKAIEAIKTGVPVKHIEKWIRQGRNAENFEPLELTATVNLSASDIDRIISYLAALSLVLEAVKDLEGSKEGSSIADALNRAYFDAEDAASNIPRIKQMLIKKYDKLP